MSNDTIQNQVFSRSPSSQSEKSRITEDSHDERLASSPALLESLDYRSDSVSSIKPKNQQQNRRKRSNGDLTHTTRFDGQSSPAEGFYPTRPNKYHGPASTWRSWTVEERELAASLDQLGAKDLAVHLFNAFALKRRARRLVQRKGQSTHGENIVHNQWAPPKIWTAWPLSPDKVPRQTNDLYWKADELVCSDRNLTGKIRQSDFMEETVISQILHKAQQGFWNWERDNPRLPKAIAAQQSDSYGLEDHLSLGDPEPVFLADDEIAQEILRPTVHHIMSKLDDLLRGLHHARTASLLPGNPASESENEVFAEHIESRRRNRGNSMNRSMGEGRKPGSAQPFMNSKTGFASSNLPRFSAAYNRRKSLPSNRQIRPLRKSKNYGLRDWSDILGIVMMTDWDSKSVQRAATRCAALFEEGIMLRTLKEDGQSVLINAENGPVWNKELGNNATNRVPYPRRLEGRTWKMVCPIADCNRSIKGFSDAYSLKRHLKHVHKTLKPPASLHAETVENEDRMCGGVLSPM